MRGVDHDAHAVEREVAREGVLDEDDVAAARVVEPLRAADGGAGAARAPCSASSAISRSISASASSGSLKPSAPKILMPLSSYGLWLALITTPASARMLLVRYATAGVGMGPQSMTSPPIEQMPEASAVSSM